MNYYKRDIRNVKGDTYSIGLTSDNEFDSIYFTCRDNLNDESTILFQKGLGDGISIVEETTEDEETIYKYAVRIAPEDTKDARSGTYYYDMQIALNGDVFTIMKGKFVVEQDATKQSAEPVDPELYIKVILDEINGEVIGTTVTDKTDYLNATKSLIKDSINYTGAALTDGDTFRSYASKLKDALINVINTGTDIIFNNLPHVTGEGTALTLEATLNAKMKLDLKGNTSQTGTPTPTEPVAVNVVSGDNEIVIAGENLFDKDNTTDGGFYAAAFISNASWCYINTTSLKAGETYFTNKRAIISFYNGTTHLSYVDKNNTTFTVPNNTTNVYISTLIENKDTLQVELGTTATKYKAYQGFQTYPINLPVENLFDKDNANILNAYIYQNTILSAPVDISIYVKIKPNTTYTIQKGLNSTQTANRFKIGTCVELPANNVALTNYIGWGDGTTETNATITSGANDNYLIVQIANNETNYNEIKDTISVANGTNIDTPIELCKIGDYQDYFYKENGKWYLHKEVGKVVLDGSEDGWFKSTGATQTNFVGALSGTNMTNIFDIPSVNNSIIKSNRFTNTTSAGATAGFIFYNVSNNKYTSFALSISTSLVNDITAFKNWLVSNNTDLYYPLATPTNTEIEYKPLIHELETLYNNIMSYEGITNINQVNNDLPFILNATALKGDEE